VDTVTDVYVLSTYYQSDELVSQANVMLAMILTNLALQLVGVVANYRKKGVMVLLREALFCIFFLRPVVDAYRVSTNHDDEEATWSNLFVMVMNKVIKLTTESIPGCIRCSGLKSSLSWL